MYSFPQILTERLWLRKLEIDDIPVLVRYANNKQISDHILNMPYPYQEPDGVFRISYVVQGFRNRSRFVFAIVLRETEELIGEVSLHLDRDKPLAELGYWIGEPLWGRGLGTEAVKAVLQFGFQRLGLSLIFASVHEENLSSRSLLSKCGLKEYGQRNPVKQYRLGSMEFSADTL